MLSQKVCIPVHLFWVKVDLKRSENTNLSYEPSGVSTQSQSFSSEVLILQPIEKEINDWGRSDNSLIDIFEKFEIKWMSNWFLNIPPKMYAAD